MGSLAELLWDLWPLLSRVYVTIRHPQENLASRFSEDELRQVFLITVVTLGFSLLVVVVYLLLLL